MLHWKRKRRISLGALGGAGFAERDRPFDAVG